MSEHDDAKHRARARHTEYGVFVLLAITTLMAVSGFFVADKLSGLTDDARELRKDVTVLRIAVERDRFTMTDWRRENAELESEHRAIRERINRNESRIDRLEDSEKSEGR